MADHPCMGGHPIKAAPGRQPVTAPICMFIDGVPVKGFSKSWGESMNVVSWSSCLAGHGATLQTNILVFSIWEHLVSKSVGHVAAARAWREIARPLTARYFGKRPKRDLGGNELDRGPEKDLAGGFRFVLFGLRAGLEASSTGARFFCARVRARALLFFFFVAAQAGGRCRE
eukprot:129095-Pyramimonas_sp.AAC.1